MIYSKTIDKFVVQIRAPISKPIQPIYYVYEYFWCTHKGVELNRHMAVGLIKNP
jgi:hypothetical protein